MRRNSHKIFFTILFLIFGLTFLYPRDLLSGENEYSISNIPAALLKNNGAVIRKKIIKVEIDGRKHALETITEAITIFNRDNQDMGQEVIMYDQFHDIDDLDGAIYDADGNKIRDLSSSDVYDRNIFESYTLYDDTREKTAEMYYDKFPYTVEFKIKIKYSGYLQLPSWRSRTSIYPVQLSRFEVEASPDDSLRIWCNNDSLKPNISADGDRITYVWEDKNLPELPEEKKEDDIEDYSDVVRIAPTNFELDDYNGKMNTWKNFGLWAYDLYKGKDKLSDDAKTKIRTLYSPQDSQIEIISKLYKFLQSTTRYVSIQLGIGGWQPLDAQFVFDKGYGDCKALTNYMMTLLETAGIKSFPVLVDAGGSRPLLTDFPSNQFDHVILCVPQMRDSIWLECTSSTLPFGHLGYQTENKNVLSLSKNGGILIKTPSTSPELNTQSREATVVIKSNGIAEVNSVTGWLGDQQNTWRSRIEYMTPEDKTKWITNSINAPNPEIKNFSFTVPEKPDSALKLKIKYTLFSYGSISGDRIFFKPNILNRYTYVPRDISDKRTPVRFGYPYLDSDSISCIIPDNYAVEAVPSEVDLHSSFGSFKSKTVQVSDKILVYTRVIKINNYSVPAKDYPEYRKFYSDIVKADRGQIVLLKKN